MTEEKSEKVKKPFYVSLIAIANLILGSAYVLIYLTVYKPLVDIFLETFKNFQFQNINQFFSIISTILALLSGPIAILAGIGLLMNKKWGKTFSIIYAFMLLYSTLYPIIEIISMYGINIAIKSITWSILWAIYGLLIIILLNNKKTQKALN